MTGCGVHGCDCGQNRTDDAVLSIFQRFRSHFGRSALMGIPGEVLSSPEDCIPGVSAMNWSICSRLSVDAACSIMICAMTAPLIALRADSQTHTWCSEAGQCAGTKQHYEEARSGEAIDMS